MSLNFLTKLLAIALVSLTTISAQNTPTADGKPQTEPTVQSLQARISNLELLVERLRAENVALRTEIQHNKTGDAVRPQAPTAPAPKPALESEDATSAYASYWISSTGKRHNSRCRYYDSSKGRKGTSSEGVACKICGG
jgi:hypothetical protein